MFALKTQDKERSAAFSLSAKMRIYLYVEMNQLADGQIKHLDQLSVKLSKVTSYSLKMQFLGQFIAKTAEISLLVDPTGFPPQGESDFQAWFIYHLSKSGHLKVSSFNHLEIEMPKVICYTENDCAWS